MKKHGEQNDKHKPVPLSVKTWRVWKRAPLSLVYNVWFHVNLYFIPSTWTGRAKKLDEVQFFIPPGWKQRIVRNHGPWRGKQNTAMGDRRYRHKLRETWKNVAESKMKELSKAASLYQSLPQGNSYNTVVGYWFVNDAVRSQEWKFPSQQLQAFSHLLWIHKPHKPIRKCKSSVGTSTNLNNLDPLLVLWFQNSRTSQSKMSDSTSQPSSRAAKSGKFALFSRAIKHSGIHLEVLSFIQNRKSFEHFVCFHWTLGISPEELGGFKANIAFIYSALACSMTILNFDFCNPKFDWFVRYQMRVLIG